jgi:TolB-like protein
MRKRVAQAGGALVSAYGEDVVLDPEHVVVDVAIFERLAASPKLDDRLSAIEAYRGPFLDGLQILEPEFEDWLRSERQHLQELAISTAEENFHQAWSERRSRLAISSLKFALRLDPLREDMHRSLMRLYAMLGQRSRALVQYGVCRDTLSKELGIGPDVLTERLLADLKSGQVSPSSDMTPVGPSQSSPVIGSGPYGALSSDKSAVMLLPFVSHSRDVEHEIFARELTEELIVATARIDALSIFDRTRDTRIPATLGVVWGKGKHGPRWVLSGSVRRIGSGVRVTVRLMDELEEKVLWADAFDREIGSLSGWQNDLAICIVGRVAERVQRLSRVQRSTDLYRHASGDSFARGLFHFDHTHRVDPAHRDWTGPYGEIFLARALFRRAAQENPRFAQAHTMLAMTYFIETFYYATQSEDLGDAIEAAEHATTLEPQDNWSHAVLGMLRFVQQSDQECEDLLRLSLRLNPDDARVAYWWAFLLIYLGKADEALHWAKRTTEIDPDFDVRTVKAFALYHVGDPEAAAREIAQLAAPGRWEACYQTAALGNIGAPEAQSKLTSFLDASVEQFEYLRLARPSSNLGFVKDELSLYRSESDKQRVLEGLHRAGL